MFKKRIIITAITTVSVLAAIAVYANQGKAGEVKDFFCASPIGQWLFADYCGD